MRKEDDSGSSSNDSSEDEDEVDSGEEELGTKNEARRRDTNKRNTVPGGMKMVQLAVLDFCIELLNQAMQRHETEIALVCALAVLGVRPAGKGFRDEEVFPSILLSIIKIAHFIVVLKAEQVTSEICEEEWAAIESPYTFDDSRYESERL